MLLCYSTSGDVHRGGADTDRNHMDGGCADARSEIVACMGWMVHGVDGAARDSGAVLDADRIAPPRTSITCG